MVAKVVGSGVDTLVIGYSIGSYRLGEEGFKPLETAKEGAGEKLFVSEPAKVELFGRTFGVQPRGIRGYEWVLANSDVAVAIARKAQRGTVFPEVYVTFRSEFLWRVGYVAAAKEFASWLATWTDVVGVRMSRVDPCVDLAMPMPKIDLAVEVVSRARKKASHFQMKSAVEYITGGHVTGYEFGSDHLVGRIYDKTLEIKKSRKGWFRDVWQSHGWDGKGTVVRVEFQLRRDVLKEFSVNSLEELQERMGDLWRYCSRDWLTVRVPGTDSNRARWGIRDYWTVVQDVGKDLGEMYGVLRLRQKRVEYDALGAQAEGVIATMVATMASEMGLKWGQLMVEHDFKEWMVSPEFRAKVADRMGKLSKLQAERRIVPPAEDAPDGVP